MHSYEFVNTNHRDVPHRQEDDPNRPKSSSPEEGNSKAPSGKELIEKDDSSKKSEIDLSYASQRTDLGGDKGKTEPEGGKEAILIQSPTEAIFEAETKPVKESSPKEKLRTASSEKRKPRSQKTKAEKLSKADLGGKRKAKGGRASKKTKPRISRPTPEKVIMSKGVAYLEGNMIRMAGGIKLRPGDQIKIGEEEFRMKRVNNKNRG